MLLQASQGSKSRNTKKICFINIDIFDIVHTQTRENLNSVQITIEEQNPHFDFFPAVVFAPQKCYKAAVIRDNPIYPSAVQSMPFKSDQQQIMEEAILSLSSIQHR